MSDIIKGFPAKHKNCRNLTFQNHVPWGTGYCKITGEIIRNIDDPACPPEQQKSEESEKGDK